MSRFLILFIWILVMFPMLGYGQTEPGEAFRLHRPTTDRDSLLRGWRQEIPSDAKTFDTLVRETRLGMDRLGIKNLRGVHMLLQQRALSGLARDDIQFARQNLNALKTLSPDAPANDRLEAALIRHEQPLRVDQWIAPLLRSQYHELNNASALVARGRGFASGLIIILSICLVLFGIGQGIRYGGHLLYALSKGIPFGWAPVSAVIALALLVYAAETFGGIYLIVAVFFVLVSLYQTSRERITTLVMILSLALIPLALDLMSKSSDSVQTTADQLQNSLDDPTDDRALSTVRSLEVGPLGGLTHAIALKKRGRFADAKSALGLLKIDPEDGELNAVATNLNGVLFAANGKLEESLDAFESAKKSGPGSPEIHFNLFRIYTQLGEDEKAESELQAANALDGAAVARWLEIEQPRLNGYFVDLYPTRDAILKAAFGSQRSTANTRMENLRNEAGLIAGLSGVCILFFWFIRRRITLPFPCQKCAAETLVPLSTVDDVDIICEACTNIFIRSSPVEHGTRVAQEIRVQRMRFFRRARDLSSALLVPGAAQCAVGKLGYGFFLAALLTMAFWQLDIQTVISTAPGTDRGFEFQLFSSGGSWLIAAYVLSWVEGGRRILGGPA